MRQGLLTILTVRAVIQTYLSFRGPGCCTPFARPRVHCLRPELSSPVILCCYGASLFRRQISSERPARMSRRRPDDSSLLCFAYRLRAGGEAGLMTPIRSLPLSATVAAWPEPAERPGS